MDLANFEEFVGYKKAEDDKGVSMIDVRGREKGKAGRDEPTAVGNEDSVYHLAGIRNERQQSERRREIK